MKTQECQQRIDERIKDALVAKEVRAHHLASEIMKIHWVGEAPQLLEAMAIELRSLAYQIRNLKAARLAAANA